MSAAEAEIKTHRLAKLEISLTLFVDALKGEGVARTFNVTKNALPEDAELQWIYADPERRTIFAVLRSESFAPVKDGDVIPELPVPFCETVR